jgi:hypothetical protein
MAEMMDTTADTTWSKLAHAYGPAEDTPTHLAGLLDPDPETNRKAIDHLWSAILHQGTVYPATAPAVVTVADMLAEVTDAVRLELLNLPGRGRPVVRRECHRGRAFELPVPARQGGTTGLGHRGTLRGDRPLTRHPPAGATCSPTQRQDEVDMTGRPVAGDHLP